MVQTTYPEVKYGGPVDLKRALRGCRHNCVLFIFERPGIQYLDARAALLQHSFYYNHSLYDRVCCPIDAIRRKSPNSASAPNQPLIIEAHFDQELYCPFSSTESSNDRNDGSFTLHVKPNGNVTVKVLKTIPEQPVYYSYIVTNIPLGAASVMVSDLRNAIRIALQDLYHVTDHNILERAIVDIVPYYKADADGKHAMFNGGFTVILDASLIKLGSTIPYQLYNEKYVLEKSTTHYLYCKRCMTLDYGSQMPDKKDDCHSSIKLV